MSVIGDGDLLVCEIFGKRNVRDSGISLVDEASVP
jgi:hypothetical protein